LGGDLATDPAHAAALVRITGVGFFDYIHGQRGVAPNGIELHPVLDVEFPYPAPWERTHTAPTR